MTRFTYYCTTTGVLTSTLTEARRYVQHLIKQDRKSVLYHDNSGRIYVVRSSNATDKLTRIYI